MNTLLFTSEEQLGLETPGKFRHALAQIIDESVADQAIRQRMQLCLSEAVTNLILHAQPKATEISISFASNDSEWWLDILDDSGAWDLAQHHDDNLLFNFTEIESGRGVALLYGQCDKLIYTAGENEQPNQLRLHWSYPKYQKQNTILLVEDNSSLLALYRAYLSQDYHVLTAMNGYQALQQLNDHNIDLVLSDIRMPEMNGLSLRKKINQQNNSKLIPFIFLTAEDNLALQQQANDLGIDDYLLKPVNKTQLLATVQRVLGRTTQVYQQLTQRVDKNIAASLKPSLPETSNGWRLQVASRDTGSGGGDLLLHKDFSSMSQIILTDIMGHDDSAKFFSHAFGGYIHGLLEAMEANKGPASILEQISNCAMNDSLLSQITLTCCSLQLSVDGKVSVATAGHPAPLLISQQCLETVPVTGILPGLLADSQYKSTDICVKQGQRLALFTDGLFDSATDNNSRNELENSINQSLLTTLKLPIKQALQEVMNTFDKLTGSRPLDDAMLILIERCDA
ncbi:MAG: response regulator [Psychromonas sp.]